MVKKNKDILRKGNKNNKKEGNIINKLANKKYYRIGYERYSSKDFKIIDVLNTISNDQIMKSLHALIRKTDLIIRSRNNANDVPVTIRRLTSLKNLGQ